MEIPITLLIYIPIVVLYKYRRGTTERNPEMDWNEYMEAVKADAKEAIEENLDYCEDWESMYDELFIDDSVTGNGSGSYCCNSAKAEEAVQGIIFEDEAIEAFKEYGYDGIPTEKGAESCDVIARCIALGYISGELEEYFDELKEEAEEEEEE